MKRTEISFERNVERRNKKASKKIGSYVGFLDLFDAGRNGRCSQQPHLCPLGNQSSFFKKQFLYLGCHANALLCN